MKIENFCGYGIRFVEIAGEWWAVLEDICDALDLNYPDVFERLDPSSLKIETNTLINEVGIYELLFMSNNVEAAKLKRWTATVLQKLRKHVGLEGNEVLKMTDEDVHAEINDFLDRIFYDEETGQLMMSVTIQGGDVDQVPIDL